MKLCLLIKNTGWSLEYILDMSINEWDYLIEGFMDIKDLEAGKQKSFNSSDDAFYLSHKE